jgi:hypothetical protein
MAEKVDRVRYSEITLVGVLAIAVIPVETGVTAKAGFGFAVPLPGQFA